MLLARTHLSVVVVGLLCIGLAGCEEKKELTVTGISPDQGDYRGGTQVIIEGTGFAKAKNIDIYFDKNNKAKNPIIHSNTKIAIEAPGGKKGEAVDVEVIFGDSRTVRLPAAYTYFDPTPPTVGDL